MRRNFRQYPKRFARYTFRHVRKTFPVAIRVPRLRALPALGSVLGAIGITLTFIAATPEARGEWSQPGEVTPPAQVTAPAWSPDFAFPGRMFAVDAVAGVAEGEVAPEGGIGEAEHAAAEAAPVVATGGRFVLPLKDWSGVTDRFGAYRGPGLVHGGIDLDVPNTARTPIYASCGGSVSHTGYSSSYGYHVIIDCGEGWTTLYGHMSAVYVVAGGNATIGETVLGTTGNTGFSTGEHLHFEILWNGSRVNPERYLDFGIAPGTPLSVGPPVYVSRPPASGAGTTSGSSASGDGGGSGSAAERDDPTATRTPSPTAAPTRTPTPIPTPTLVPVPPHGSGLGECPRSDSGAVNCGPAPHAVVCTPSGWFLDYGGNFTNPRGWPVLWVNAVLDASGAC